MHNLVPIIVAIILAAIGGRAALAQAPRASITVAAASDLQVVFPELGRGFEQATGIRAAASFGSSGNFFAQIQNGAPFDVFMSADADYPLTLAASGHAEARTLVRYGLGRIVLWTRQGSGVDITRGLQSLTGAGVRHIAIANPEHAPYGRAAVAALRHEGIYDAVRSRLVLGENISQTAQLADSGNADVAIIALSLVRGPVLAASGRYAEIPVSTYPPIDQAAALVAASAKKAEARRFLAYLQSADARRLLDRFGFGAPEANR